MTTKKDEFKALLDDKGTNENDAQLFLEKNTEFIPLMFLLNHQLHFNSVVSKFKISDRYTADFMYLTKSSDEWYCVLIEIENQHKKIFTKNKENINFSQDFNHWFDQISHWKQYIDENKSVVIDKLKHLRVPLERNRVNFKYILVIGRSEEKKLSEQQKMFTAKNNDTTRIITYDTVADSSYTGPKKHIILSPWKEWYKIKNLDSLDLPFFANLNPSNLKLNKSQKDILIKNWYDIENWEKWNPLDFNQKQNFKTIRNKS